MFRKISIKITVQIFIILFLTAILPLAVYSAPVDPFPMQVTQADGTEITIQRFGDEFFIWVQDTNGYIIAYDEESENWCYAYISDGQILPNTSSLVFPDTFIGPTSPFNFDFDSGSSSSKLIVDDLIDIINNIDRSIYTAEPLYIDDDGNVFTDSEFPDVIISGISPITHTKNRQPLLVLLIDYNNRAFSTTAYGSRTVMQHWENHFFGTTGKTVNTYYREVSGTFNLQFIRPTFTKTGSITTGLPTGVTSVLIQNSVARVRLNKNHPNNDNLIGADIRLAFNAVKGHINFSSVPITSNTVLCEDFNVYAIIAGYGSGSTTLTPSIGGHVQRGSFIINGKERNSSINNFSSTRELKTYGVNGELADTTTPHPIGTTVHELGHILGVLDLYSYIKGEGVGQYSLMGNGNWGAISGEIGGTTPVHFDAWSKARLGFVTPTIVSSTQYGTYSIRSFNYTSGYNALKVTSTANSAQYFMVENRQLSGFDRGLERWRGTGSGTSGILIYHVDEDVYDGYKYVNGAWTGRPNDNDLHKNVDLEKYYGNQTSNNPFYVSGTGNAFIPSSTPNSNFHTAGHTTNPTVRTNCHPQTVRSGIEIRVNSTSSTAMSVEVGRRVTITTSVSPTAGGTATVSGTYNLNTQVTLKATPNSGYTFDGWYEGTTKVSTNATYTFTALANRTLQARFKTIITYSVTLTASPTAGGTVSGGGTYNSGTQVTVKATPSTGYIFDGWYEGSTRVSTSATYTFTISANRTFQARFKLNTYTVTLTASPTAGGTVSGGGTYDALTRVPLRATPNNGYVFDGWYENGVLVTISGEPAGSAIAITSLLRNWTLEARFKKSIYGDINGDGRVTREDAALILKYLVGAIEFTPYQMEAANVFGDGTITAANATLILQYIADPTIKLGP